MKILEIRAGKVFVEFTSEASKLKVWLDKGMLEQYGIPIKGIKAGQIVEVKPEE